MATVADEKEVRLAARINQNHHRYLERMKGALAYAVRVGEDLLRAKQRFGKHGNWLPWVEGNLDFSLRTAQVYMRLAKNKDEVLAQAEEIGLVSIDKAVDLLCGKRIDGNEFYTPEWIVEKARKVMGGIDLDPASTTEANQTIRAERFFSWDDDGLKKQWPGRVFLNPPFFDKQNKRWVVKLQRELDAGRTTQCFIILQCNIWGCIDSPWFQTIRNNLVCIPHRRPRYFNPMEQKESDAPGGTFFCYVGQHASRFRREFGEVGEIIRRV